MIKTQELPRTLSPGPPPGFCPWTPPVALERVPGPQAVRRSAHFVRSTFMDSKLLTLPRPTNTKFVLTGLGMLDARIRTHDDIDQNWAIEVCK